MGEMETAKHPLSSAPPNIKQLPAQPNIRWLIELPKAKALDALLKQNDDLFARLKICLQRVDFLEKSLLQTNAQNTSLKQNQKLLNAKWKQYCEKKLTENKALQAAQERQIEAYMAQNTLLATREQSAHKRAEDFGKSMANMDKQLQIVRQKSQRLAVERAELQKFLAQKSHWFKRFRKRLRVLGKKLLTLNKQLNSENQGLFEELTVLSKQKHKIVSECKKQKTQIQNLKNTLAKKEHSVHVYAQKFAKQSELMQDIKAQKELGRLKAKAYSRKVKQIKHLATQEVMHAQNVLIYANAKIQILKHAYKKACSQQGAKADETLFKDTQMNQALERIKEKVALLKD